MFNLLLLLNAIKLFDLDILNFQIEIDEENNNKNNINFLESLN